ncbi:MAG TPA: hypothetical protein VMO00_20610 [Methylomirabilota bacterium]|nr:hypothetical protein [Methylomirabilota bacterium]
MPKVIHSESLSVIARRIVKKGKKSKAENTSPAKSRNEKKATLY